ncbi:hypothetical protein NL676_031592 [Syzygium grande]|nr:hypothetical protein NL676_031592 [Syzygium grande]
MASSRSILADPPPTFSSASFRNISVGSCPVATGREILARFRALACFTGIDSRVALKKADPSETFQKSQSNDRLPLARDDFPVSHTIRARGHTLSSLLPLAAARIATFAPSWSRDLPCLPPKKTPRAFSTLHLQRKKRAGHPPPRYIRPTPHPIPACTYQKEETRKKSRRVRFRISVAAADMVKRDREDTEVEALAMANCLMLLSRVGESTDPSSWPTNRKSGPGERMFACKTCNREFSSFQALGGHRASHKKPKMISGDLFHLGRSGESSPAKPKTHECSICGLEFPIGQALGGHMRRHRAAIAEAATKPVPVLKKSNSKRVMCLDLNSSLTEDDLTLRLGKVAPPLVLDLVL